MNKDDALTVVRIDWSISLLDYWEQCLSEGLSCAMTDRLSTTGTEAKRSTLQTAHLLSANVTFHTTIPWMTLLGPSVQTYFCTYHRTMLLCLLFTHRYTTNYFLVCINDFLIDHLHVTTSLSASVRMDVGILDTGTSTNDAISEYCLHQGLLVWPAAQSSSRSCFGPVIECVPCGLSVDTYFNYKSAKLLAIYGQSVCVLP